MAWTTPATVAPLDTLSASFWNEQVRDNLNAISRGLLAYTSTTAQTGFSTTEADILSRTWTATAGHNYLVIAGVSGIIKQTNAGDVVFKITDGSNGERTKWIRFFSVDGVQAQAWLVEVIRNASAGSVTRKSRQITSSAGGVFNRGDQGANNATFLAIIDIGNTSV